MSLEPSTCCFPEGPPSSAEAQGHRVFPENQAGSRSTLETSLALRTSGQLAAEGTAPAPFFQQECEALGSLGPVQASQNCCKTTALLCLGHGATGGIAQPRSPTWAFAVRVGSSGVPLTHPWVGSVVLGSDPHRPARPL